VQGEGVPERRGIGLGYKAAESGRE